ncbi:hypothetical protein NEOLEDRAFT_741133 [Neolentinus lepideus HHB14362 ss-1]|uniref:BTB domain-containing protein n=1 Tax=Neolentinus lepideus HHB14362 ss-1 TaxID=1314782 RepID=A0A165PVW5_9AGAM|nr:hypothetical protein NEOLEDRAFT_741133 [Neolentinus lepideus HHB14362 ss-1]
MLGTDIGAAKRSFTLWETTKCISHCGTIEFRDIRQGCEERRGHEMRWTSDWIIINRWKIMLTIADRNTDWIAVYLVPAKGLLEKPTCAHLRATLRKEDRVIALYDMQEKPYDFGPQRKYEYLNWGERHFCPMDKVLEDDAVKMNDVMSLDYVVTEYPDDYLSQSAPLNLRPSLRSLRDMMAIMFDDADTADACFVVRHSAVSNDRPQRIYAHTKILMSRCGYFQTLFESGFVESKHAFDDPDTFTQHQWEEGSDSDYEELADLEGDGCSSGAQVQMTDKTLGSGGSVPSDGQAIRTTRNLKVVYVTDSSYRTYKALLYYLYTGCIAFAPLRSIYNIAKENALSANRDSTFPCRTVYNNDNALVISVDGEMGQLAWTSAKSIYRLCDKLGVPELKEAAARFIRDSLIPEVVMHEFRSTFTTLFPEILKNEDAYIAEHWADVCKTKSFEEYMTELIGTGEQSKYILGHIMSALRSPRTLK